jgi:ribose transport system ATP-binding protein
MQIEMKNISKSFNGVPVLKNVQFSVLPGEVHALMGENGAGKSTLMKILTGVYTKDAGTILINGKETTFKNPKQAEQAGIAFIHQELNIWPNLTVAENLFLGREHQYGKTGILKNKEMNRLAEEWLANLGLAIKATTLAGKLSVGQQQMIEIAKALMTNAEVIIMDEPTSALTEREIETLFKVIQKLKNQGVSFIYISHRMEEIFHLCDRVTVLRDGQYIATKSIKETSLDEVVRFMVGRTIGERYPQLTHKAKDIFLEVKQLTKRGMFENISFHVRQGEILGVAGLMGAGRTEIMKSIFGFVPADEGEIFIQGNRVRIKNPYDAIRHGIGFVTEDRKSEGLILHFSIRENIALPNLKRCSSYGWISDQGEKSFVEELVQKLNVKATGIDQPVKSLSGGNQQKVVLAKWLGIEPKLLILDEPTRGVDIAAKKEIYFLIQQLAQRGVAIIMVSSELPELLSMSDRIMVILEGRISGFLGREEATQEKIMNLATGGK